MTVDEIKKIVELLGTLDYDRPEDQKTFSNEAYEPVKEAIKDNDMTVIMHLETCDKATRKRLSTAVGRGLLERRVVNEGVIREGYERAVNLCRDICNENGWKREF